MQSSINLNIKKSKNRIVMVSKDCLNMPVAEREVASTEPIEPVEDNYCMFGSLNASESCFAHAETLVRPALIFSSSSRRMSVPGTL